MSLSEAPKAKITFHTAPDISDEILGAAFHFCNETGYQQNIMVLTFFWAAFLHVTKSQLSEHELFDEVKERYAKSLSYIFPDISTNAGMRTSVEELSQHYWNNLSSDFGSIATEEELTALFQIADSINTQNGSIASAPLAANPQVVFRQITTALSAGVYRIIHQIENEEAIEYRSALHQIYLQQTLMEMAGKGQNMAQEDKPVPEEAIVEPQEVTSSPEEEVAAEEVVSAPVEVEPTPEKAEKTVNKKRVALCTITPILVVLLVLAIIFLIIPGLRYHHAKKLLENGNPELAYSAFLKLDGFSDSEDMLLECRYIQAIKYLDAGDYEVANKIFSSLGDYRDSQMLIHEHDYKLIDIEPDTYRCSGCGDSYVVSPNH